MNLKTGILTLAATALFSTAAQAGCLKDALAQIYGANPLIAAEREQLSLADTQTRQTRERLTAETGPAFALPLVENAPIDAATAEYRAARSREKGARERFEALEEQVLLEGIAGILTLAEAKEITELMQLNVKSLQYLLQISEGRFAGGASTAADLAQARVQARQARIQYAHAKALLARLRASYTSEMHTPAPDCALPPIPEGLPADRDEALSLAANARRENNPSLPATLISARVPQVDDVGGAWQEFMTMQYSRALLVKAAQAARQKVDGLESSLTDGSGGIPDVVAAEQEALNAQVNLVHLQKSSLLQAYRLLAVVGRLSSERLRLSSAPAQAAATAVPAPAAGGPYLPVPDSK